MLPVGLLGLVEHVGLHPGRDHVRHAYPGAPELAPQRLAERHHPGLRGRVRRCRREERVARDARVVHDPPAPALQHRRQDETSEFGQRPDIEIDHRALALGVLLLETAATAEASVVDQGLDAEVRRRQPRH